MRTAVFSAAKTMVDAIISLPFFLRKGVRTRRRRILLLLSPEYVNFGDLAIASMERRMLADLGYDVLEVPCCTHEYWPESVVSTVRDDDILMFTGGGYMGSLWPDLQGYVEHMLESCPNNVMVFAPQTVYFGEDFLAEARFISLLGACRKVLFLARDAGTRSWLESFDLPSVSVQLIPDAVICAGNWLYEGRRGGLLKCFRDDHESVLQGEGEAVIRELSGRLQLPVTETSTMVRHVMTPLWMRDSLLSWKLRDFQHAELVITDRLHAMVFSALSGTRVVALDNVSGKVSGARRWLSGLDYVRVASSIEDVEGLAQEVLRIGDRDRARMLSTWSKNCQAAYSNSFCEAVKGVCDCS